MPEARYISIVIVPMIVATDCWPKTSATMALVSEVVAPQESPREMPARSKIPGVFAWSRRR